MTHGFAQTPFDWQLSQLHGGPGNAQIVSLPAMALPPPRVAVPAAAPATAPNSRSEPRPKRPRRLVLRATRSLTLLRSDITLR